MEWEGTGIELEALQRYVFEQIDTLPGVEDPGEVLSVVLSGSRATGTWHEDSDVDLEVLCTREVYERAQKAAFKNGLIRSPDSFGIVTAPEEGWESYFGGHGGRPHFSVRSLEDVRRQMREYEDVWLWVWSHARVFRDPESQFGKIRNGFSGYPRDVLIRKIKYRWLLAGHWAICASPSYCGPESLLAGGSGLLNAVNELLRLCFLLEGKPFPYTSKLMRFAQATPLGREFIPIFQRMVDLALGETEKGTTPWDRLEMGFNYLLNSESCPECQRLESAFFAKMIEAGVPEEWVKADFKNLDDLLHGNLGPIPL